METKKCIHGSEAGKCSACAALINRVNAHNREFEKIVRPPDQKCGHGRNPEWCTACRYSKNGRIR